MKHVKKSPVPQEHNILNKNLEMSLISATLNTFTLTPRNLSPKNAITDTYTQTACDRTIVSPYDEASERTLGVLMSLGKSDGFM